MPSSDAARLRVAVVGLSEDEAGWVGQLGGSGIDVVTARSVRDVRDGEAHLVVVFADLAEVAAMAAAELGAEPAVPLAIFVGAPLSGRADPRARLLKVVLDGKREWERTFDSIVDPLMVLNDAGQVVRANLQMARALGRPIGEVVGRHYAALLGPAVPGTGDRFAAEAEDPIAFSLADGAPRNVEGRYRRLPGLHEIRISTVGEARNEGVVVMLKDVSDRREQQERLQRSARLADIGQLAAGIAHEINTPLASIALRAESLMKSAEDPRLRAIDAFKNFPRYLRTIDEEIFRCKKIIGALLDFSRARRPEVRETDLNQLAEKAADLVGHQIKLKHVTLELALDASLPAVTADDGQLRQCLLALLMNALDATAAGGRIELSSTRAADGRVELTVSDTGAGIPREHLEKVFNPFFTTKPVGQGTGLGLSICHGIVAAHGGEIRVDSEVGRGTRMTVVLAPTRGARAS